MSASVGVRRTGRRRYLISLSIMGVLVCALGSTGLFAALNDSARTGSNHVDSAALPGAADLRISPAHVGAPTGTGFGGTVICDEPFSEDLTTGGFNFSNVTPGSLTGVSTWYCVKNVGSQTVNITVTIDSLSDVDLDCSGDEALYNDVTCGNQLAGELSSVLQVFYETPFCPDLGLAHPNGTIGLAANVNQSPNFLQMALTSGSQLCIGMQVRYPTTTATDAVQQAQSDSVSWRFKFTGVAQP